uniref:C-type lectin mannose-binding isoform-like n=1 Tax=Crassostrea virginica TaxID=6565 RepID=A0A8B8D5I1_CRAVI|nr:C-type lectin mannose-binding isoform-like [Crassostrea virginica]
MSMLWIATLLIFNILISTSEAYNFVCKDGWGYRHNDYCYQKFTGLSLNWNSARAICRMYGGFLVGIRDRQKQYHIQGLASGVSHLWTGGNDIRSERTWEWDGGGYLSYSNWDSHEPNDDGNEDCLELRSEKSWKWNDEDCGLARPFICELHACHLPDHCITTTCTNTYDFQCTKCQHQASDAEHSLYWPTANKKACEVSKEAHIETCRLGAESDKGEVGNSTSHGDCEKEESTYINFQPKSLSYTFVTSFDTLNNMPSKPIHIHESRFGVVHAEIRLYKEDLNKNIIQD